MFPRVLGFPSLLLHRGNAGPPPCTSDSSPSGRTDRMTKAGPISRGPPGTSPTRSPRSRSAANWRWTAAHAQRRSIEVFYEANFNTQYLLTAAASPSVGGTVTANPASASGYYNSGASVQLTAAANSGYQCSAWGGSLSGTANPHFFLTFFGERFATSAHPQPASTAQSTIFDDQTTPPPFLLFSIDSPIRFRSPAPCHASV
jgi:hypothetical protein